MKAPPYRIDHQGQRYDFPNPESMLHFLYDKKQSHIDIYYLNSVKISCDLQQGKVVFSDRIAVSPYLTNTIFFESESKAHLISLVAQLIGLVAKLNLLTKLQHLGDPEISEVLRSHHFDVQEWRNKKYNMNMMQTEVDKIFKKISLLDHSPLHDAVRESITAYQVVNIKSEKAVTEVMNSINQLIEQKALDKSSPRPRQ